jgi:hypothetical protein
MARRGRPSRSVHTTDGVARRRTARRRAPDRTGFTARAACRRTLMRCGTSTSAAARARPRRRGDRLAAAAAILDDGGGQRPRARSGLLRPAGGRLGEGGRVPAGGSGACPRGRGHIPGPQAVVRAAEPVLALVLMGTGLRGRRWGRQLHVHLLLRLQNATRMILNVQGYWSNRIAEVPSTRTDDQTRGCASVRSQPPTTTPGPGRTIDPGGVLTVATAAVVCRTDAAVHGRDDVLAATSDHGCYRPRWQL